MRRFILAITIGLFGGVGVPQKTWAYDIDCAIMLCMAGGFPPSAVCARAYRTMIRRITPWPSLPPFGICTYAAVPVVLGGVGADADLDTTLPDYEWLNRTHVIWWYGRDYRNRDGDHLWDWSIRSCDRENRTCSYIQRVHGSHTRWPETFVAESGQVIVLPVGRGFGSFYARAIMVEFGDYEGNMGHSEWFPY